MALSLIIFIRPGNNENINLPSLSQAIHYDGRRNEGRIKSDDFLLLAVTTDALKIRGQLNSQ